jgi:hypothetical protein
VGRSGAPIGAPERIESALHVDEERRVATALRHDAFTLLRSFARFFAVLAANRERQCTKPTLGDLFTALKTVPECPLFETVERLFDLVKGLGFHLNEGEFDLILDVGFRALGSVQNAGRGIVGALSTNVPDFALYLIHYFATALLENTRELRVTIPIHLSARRLMNIHMIPLLSISARPGCPAVMQ